MTPDQVEDLFVNTLKDKTVKVVVVDHDEYIERSRNHHFIKLQIKHGIYNEETFADEFLSTACTYARERRIDIDPVLISKQMEGVDPLHANAYVQIIALHEYHHVEYHRIPARNQREQLDREAECDTYIRQNYPELQELAEKAEQASPLIQKVYERMATLRPEQ